MKLKIFFVTPTAILHPKLNLSKWLSYQIQLHIFLQPITDSSYLIQ